MTRMLTLLVRCELTSPCEHLLTKVTSVRQHSCVQGALVDLQVGLGSESLVAKAALEVPPAFVDHLDVSLQLHFACQQLSTVVTWEHLLGDDFSS